MCAITDISGHPQAYRRFVENRVPLSMVDGRGFDDLAAHLEGPARKYGGKTYPYGLMPIVHQVGQGEVAAKLARFRLVEPWLLKEKSLKFSGRISTYNARSERFTEKKPRAMWPNYFKAKRCLIFVTGFYEYQYRDRDGRPQPGLDPEPHHKCLYKMTATSAFPGYEAPDDASAAPVFAFAGLYNEFQWTVKAGRDTEKEVSVVSNAIVTAKANHKLAWVHNADPDDPRMPVVLDPKDYAAYLDVETGPIDEALAFCRPCPDDWLDAQEA